MIHVDENLCKGCHLCVYVCYKNVYAIPSDANKKGVLVPFVKFEDRCTDCGVCEVSCPDQAITVDVNGNWWVKEDNYGSFNPKFSQVNK